jgi:hypothetical protein
MLGSRRTNAGLEIHQAFTDLGKERNARWMMLVKIFLRTWMLGHRSWFGPAARRKRLML